MQLICGLGAYGAVARRGMELCALGHCFFSAAFPRKVDFWKAAGEKPCGRPCLHGAADSCDMGHFCDNGYGTACRVSGQSLRISQGGHTGWDHAADPISQRVWHTFDSVCYIFDAPADKAVLEVEGPLVCGADSFRRLLVVGEGDCPGEQ